MRIGLVGTALNPLQRGGPAPELAAQFPSASFQAFPSRVPAFPYTPLEQAMQALGHSEAALSAAEQGCERLVIDSVGDYGLAAIRAMLPVPAIGSGEAGLAAAAEGGRRFGIVTVWPKSMNFILSERLLSCSLLPLCTGIVNIGSDADAASLTGPDSYLAKVRQGQAAIRQQVLAGIEKLAADGAKAVMLGCTCMSPMAHSLSAASPVPVINPLEAAVRAALDAPPIAKSLQLRKGRPALLRAMVDAVAGDMAEDCPVCVT